MLSQMQQRRAVGRTLTASARAREFAVSVLSRYRQGTLCRIDAADTLGVSCSQFDNLWRRYRTVGRKALQPVPVGCAMDRESRAKQMRRLDEHLKAIRDFVRAEHVRGKRFFLCPWCLEGIRLDSTAQRNVHMSSCFWSLPERVRRGFTVHGRHARAAA